MKKCKIIKLMEHIIHYITSLHKLAAGFPTWQSGNTSNLISSYFMCEHIKSTYIHAVVKYHHNSYVQNKWTFSGRL